METKKQLFSVNKHKQRKVNKSTNLVEVAGLKWTVSLREVTLAELGQVDGDRHLFAAVIVRYLLFLDLDDGSRVDALDDAFLLALVEVDRLTRASGGVDDDLLGDHVRQVGVNVDEDGVFRADDELL